MSKVHRVHGEAAGTWTAWRVLVAAQLREQPLRVWITLLAVALGVALGSAVYLVTAAALNEFTHAAHQLAGAADVIVRGPPEGFSEQWFVTLSRNPAVRAASPVVELNLTLPGRRLPLQVLGLDPFRAADIQPTLMAQLGGDVTRLFSPDAIVLSRAAADDLQLQRGATFMAVVGSRAESLHVIDVLPDTAYAEPLGIMDIASAQWTLQRLGVLTRIDLRLRDGVNAQIFRRQLNAALPAGVVALTPASESGRAATATRAYRINLDMLALVALLTGAVLVFSTQSLAVLRRRTAIGLLRALGVTRAQLRGALLLEGAAIGAAGSLLGLLLGTITAAVVLRYLGTDLGNRQLASSGARFVLNFWPMLLFFVIGVAVSCLGAWLPADEAARRAPARALKAGDVEPALSGLSMTLPGLALIATGLMMSSLPPVGNVPLPGYLAIAELLAGAVMLMPALVQAAMQAVPRIGRVVADTAVAQLRGSAGLATVSLAAIIVSFSLMVAMSVMVHSFRASFDLWLLKLLPADLELRLSSGSDTGDFSAADQARIAATPGVARVQFQRERTLWLRTDRAPVTLIARGADEVASALPLVRSADQPPPVRMPSAWISEAMQDLYGYRPGGTITLPLAGRSHAFFIAGVWRDYAHPAGAVVITRPAYESDTGDHRATAASLWTRPGVNEDRLEAAIRNVLPGGGRALLVMSTSQWRTRSLQLFDRAFAITYALEVIAVGIGLVGVSVASNSTVFARRAQFGMLRHIGMLRRQVQLMLAAEGVLMSLFAVLYGLVLGMVLSLILVYVINRQSFHWSIDLVVPGRELTVLGLILIVAAALTALWSGRAATSLDAVQAVREDW